LGLQIDKALSDRPISTISRLVKLVSNSRFP
jgi:hypothetical protein